MQAHISSHKMKGDRIPCGDSRESHSPPALLDRRPLKVSGGVHEKKNIIVFALVTKVKHA